MRAVVFHEFGGPERLSFETVPDLEPDPDEVIVGLQAVGLNHFDLDILAGISGIEVPMPHIPGLEGAGEIIETGANVRGFAPGERVAPTFSLSKPNCRIPHCPCGVGLDNLCLEGGILGVTAPGTYAESVKVNQHNLVRLPDGLHFEAAAAGQVTMGTAWQMLVEQIRIRPGEIVLVNAAGGGIGSAAIQIAKLAGATVIASAGSAFKLDRADAIGADFTIDYSESDLYEAIMEFTGGRGVDAVVESVGGEMLTASMRALAMGGRLATCGAHAGETTPIDIIDLFRRQITMMGTHGASRHHIEQVFDHIAGGRLAPQIHQRFPLAEADRAHAVAASRNFFGKILLLPRGEGAHEPNH